MEIKYVTVIISLNKYDDVKRLRVQCYPIPATSVIAKRLFSKACLLIRKHRNWLKDGSARLLLVITCSQE